MRWILPTAAATILCSLVASPAAADCICRGPGITAKHGQIVCLKTPSGPRLAMCGMVLNNSSWKFLDEACPEASLSEGKAVAGLQSHPLVERTQHVEF